MNKLQNTLLTMCFVTLCGWLSPISTQVSIGQEPVFEALRPELGSPPLPVAIDLIAVEPAPVLVVDPAVPQPAAQETVAADDAPAAEVTDNSQLESTETKAAPTKSDEIRNLSVRPGSWILPGDRPAWVGAEADLSTSTHRLYVGSIPASNRTETEEALDIPMVAALQSYIDEHVFGERGVAEKLPISPVYIRRNLINDPLGYTAEINTSEGTMFQKWVTLSITADQRSQFKKWHHDAQQLKRLEPLGVLLFGVLGLVGASHLLLRGVFGKQNLPRISGEIANTADPPQVAQVVGYPVAMQYPVAKQQPKARKSARFGLMGILLLLVGFVVFAFLATTVKVYRHSEAPSIIFYDR